MSELLPSSTVYTSFFDDQRFGDRLDASRVRTWPLQRLVGPTSHFRQLLPLYPLWFSSLDLRAYDVILSSSIAFSKAVRVRPDARHITYVYTPMRYAWDLDAYLSGSSYSLPARIAARTIRPSLRYWDRRTGQKPDVVVAISETVRERIKRLWGRDSLVIYPPVDTDEIPSGGPDEGFLLVAARLLAYRRIDLAVSAATRLGRELVVVGDGPERARLESLAGPTVRFMDHLPRAKVVDLFTRCHAYLVPGVEDFGIAPLEAMAAGKRVVAYRSGGATETVADGITGTFFDEQTPEALASAIEAADDLVIDPVALRMHAKRFDTSVFRQRFRELLSANGARPDDLAAD